MNKKCGRKILVKQKEVAIIGACNREWIDELMELSESGKRTISIPWKGPVIARHSHEEKLLRIQLDSIGYFKLYFYFSKRRSSVGRIEYVAFVNDAKFSNEEIKTPFREITPKEYLSRKYKQWFKVSSIKKLSRPLDLQDFKAVGRSEIDHSTLQKGFAYVFDVPSSLIAFDTFHIVDFSKEDYLEQLLIDNPHVLNMPNLKLIARQKNTPKGKIDLIFKQGKQNIVIVEVKNEELDDSGIIQLKDYLGWAEKEYTGKNIIGILICKSVSRRQKDVISQDRKNGCNIEARTYECGLRLIYN